MKYLFIFMLFLSSVVQAQSDQTAYDKVIEIMELEFDYTYDSTSNVIHGQKPIERKANAICNTPSSLPQNMSPLVLANHYPVKMEELKLWAADEIIEVKIMAGDVKSTTLYGTRGSKGVINLIFKN